MNIHLPAQGVSTDQRLLPFLIVAEAHRSVNDCYAVHRVALDGQVRIEYSSRLHGEVAFWHARLYADVEYFVLAATSYTRGKSVRTLLTHEEYLRTLHNWPTGRHLRNDLVAHLDALVG